MIFLVFLAFTLIFLVFLKIYRDRIYKEYFNNNMSIVNTTLISHVFNEEYLLPLWLNHHKDMFDNIIIIDYDSTDNSLKICKEIYPNCKIIRSRNRQFDAHEIDKEVMDIENSIEGIKIVLNVTEFLICKTSIQDIFANGENPISYSINSVSPYSSTHYTIMNNYELFKILLNHNTVYHSDRGARYIHNFFNGKYTVGRHYTHNKSIPTDKAYIIWFGCFPINDQLIKRKLQIQTRMPESDKEIGLGIQHITNKDKLLNDINNKVKTGKALKEINSQLYELLITIN